VHREACLAAALVAAALAGCATVPSRPEGPGPAQVAAAPSAPAPAAGREVAEHADTTTRETEQDLPDSDDDSATASDAADAAPSAELRARLVARARHLLGQRGPFRVGGERFTPDCSGFVAAVYAAEGLDLRGAMQRAAPNERGGAKAAWAAARAEGTSFGPDERPEPGDLVYWHDTYDRNRNRKADDPFTHVGIVERVEDGTVHFIHRGHRGVARGVMTLGHPHEATGADGRRLNSQLRSRSHPVKHGGLAAELLAGYSRPRAADAGPLARGGSHAPRTGKRAPHRPPTTDHSGR
jgi:cell wall-associated NlpC family hydrolase